MRDTRKPSYRLNRADAAVVKLLLSQGLFVHRIAAMFDVNPGRISEIKTGRRFADVDAAAP
jgi:hypothetical protein